ncbi:hypothetical protein [Paenibacillus radicis (ex Xue et al. 2023)]|uniref:Serine acetyltransferase n=1 Tax=Paenibacillus radicis (ex Xue et al. 2023) TaxID=2972489 RepID=A0ABT1YRN5_9BACL|nr:hypothetical protein [Paenibacillus radicis (ex Xue et al. 2023)]MCR8635039.1 hypothetical protein [Paenibacillus radicis (ex Xue et al. 2023)]
MNLSLPYNEFTAYTLRQLNNMFPDRRVLKLKELQPAFEQAIERTAYCFRHVTLTGYSKEGEPNLNHLHSDQYAVYLWFLSNAVWQLTQNEAAANKLFYLNKALHGFSCMYDTLLPDIFLLLHTTGTVLGKAAYSDFFVAAQGCTVGNHQGHYPVLGQRVAMLPGSSIIGECHIGDRVSVGIGATLYRQDVPEKSVVYKESSGQLKIRHSSSDWASRVFHHGYK